MKMILTLLVTFILGLFLSIGTFLAIKSKDKLKNISIPLVIGSFIALSFFELLPNALKIITKTKPAPFNYLVVIGFSLLGVVIIKIIDRFIFNHNNYFKKKSNYDDNLMHVTIVTLIPVMLYNAVEGILLYKGIYSSLGKSIGVLISLGLVNIIFGYFVGDTFNKKYTNNSSIIKTFLIGLSSLLGGIVIILFEKHIVNYEIGVLLCMIVGMSLYSVLFEILHLVEKQEKKKNLIWGIIGFSIVLLSQIF